MKGLSLTLTVVVVAIALLITVLVVVTIFGGQMASFLGVLNPWYEDVTAANLCNQRCVSWCQANIGQPGKAWSEYPGFKVTYRGETKTCDEIKGLVGLATKCSCTITTKSEE